MLYYLKLVNSDLLPSQIKLYGLVNNMQHVLQLIMVQVMLMLILKLVDVHLCLLT